MSNIPRTPKRLDFQKLCLRYYLQRSGETSKSDPELVADLLSLGDVLGLKLKAPSKVDDLFLKGLFDLSVKMRGKELPWFQFKSTMSSRAKLLERWRKNLSKEERYDLYLLSAQTLKKLGSQSSFVETLKEFQSGLGLDPEECDRIRNGQPESHNITTVSILRLISADSNVEKAKAFVRKNYHLSPSHTESLISSLRSKEKRKIKKVSDLLESYLKAPRLSPAEVKAFKNFSEKFKAADALSKLDEYQFMTLIKPFFLHHSRLKLHPALVKEIQSWFKHSEMRLIKSAAKLNHLLYGLGTKPLMERKLADVLEQLLGKKRPHFPDAGEAFRREYYVFLQTDLCLLGASHRSFAANLLRPLKNPVSFSSQSFVYELLKSYVRFHRQSGNKSSELKLSKKAEKEFWEILRELKIPRDSVLKALRLVRLHHQIVLRLHSSQLVAD